MGVRNLAKEDKEVKDSVEWTEGPKKNSVKVCAVIPAHNEAETIGKIIRETKKYIDKIFVIDDGSTDDTAKVAEENGALVIKHKQNRGVGAAQRTGYEAALKEGFEYIVQLDADGQHNPRYIPEMLNNIYDHDIIIGSRYLNNSYKKYPLIRKIGISFFTFVVNLLVKGHITDVTSGYRMYKASALRKLPPIPDRHWAVYQSLTAVKYGLRIREISVEMPLRKNGYSQLDGYKILLYPFKMLPIIFRALFLNGDKHKHQNLFTNERKQKWAVK